MDWNNFNFENAANGAVILLGFFLTAIGLRNGSKKKDEELKPIELAGAIIDKRKADEIVQVVSLLVETMREHGRMFEEIHDDLKEARAEIRELIKEIIRASK